MGGDGRDIQATSTSITTPTSTTATTSRHQQNEARKKRLLRFDDKDDDFCRMNKTLEEISSLNENDYLDTVSLYDYLISKNFSLEMIKMAEAGYSNTLCSNARDLSLKQCIRWEKIWNEEEIDETGVGGDGTFVNSFKSVIDRLKKDVQVELNTPVVSVRHPKSSDDLDLICLTTANGVKYYAKNVVITAPPPVIASKISFHPPLSDKLAEALTSVNMHRITKVFLKFSEPAWPKDLNGVIMAGNDDFIVPEGIYKCFSI